MSERKKPKPKRKQEMFRTVEEAFAYYDVPRRPEPSRNYYLATSQCELNP